MKPLYIRNFSIRLVEIPSGVAPFTLDKGRTVLEIKSDKSLFNPDASVILADPFLYVKDDTLFLFYEHLNKWYGTGRICMRSTKNLTDWTDEQDVLVEPFHLSFPFVFEDNGQFYMLPETSGANKISLYVAEDNTLTNWRQAKTLMVGGTPWVDSVIYKLGGYYYLFSGHDNNVQQEQHLFVSDHLMGPYKEHPASPICKGLDGGRNAGSLFEYRGELYRPVQMCENSYGEQVSIMKIESLSPTDYKETHYKDNLLNTSICPYEDGGHQWNFVEFKGRTIVATDYREKNFNVIEFARRIKKVICKL